MKDGLWKFDFSYSIYYMDLIVNATLTYSNGAALCPYVKICGLLPSHSLTFLSLLDIYHFRKG